MIIVQYIPAAGTDTREPARAEFATIAQLLAVPWVVQQRQLAKTSFIRFSLAQGDTLMMEYKAANDTTTFKVIGHIHAPDPRVLVELPIWEIP